MTELIGPILRADAEFLSPRYRRHPRDGIFVTQVMRPLVRSVYGVALDEPLGAEFACSGRFAAHGLGQDIWTQDAARFATDLWLRTEALAARFSVGQVWRPATTAAGAQTTLREAVRQVVLSLIESLRAHESFWLNAHDVVALPTWGTDPRMMPDAATWDHLALAEQARRDLIAIKPLLEEVLEPTMVAQLLDDPQGTSARLDDELWVRSVYAFVASARPGRTNIEHLADMFVPLYMQRAAAFMSRTASEPAAAVQARLNSLCQTFQRLKPVLVAGWSVQV